MRRPTPLILSSAVASLLFGGLAIARGSGREDANALVLAKRQAEAAALRSTRLEKEARNATNEAAKARAASSALVASIEASEADITAAEARVRIVERLRKQQMDRLAERQEPIVRLTAALQMMARRPPALALVQPGSLNDLVRIRALLASTLPVIRERTAVLRAEVRKADERRAQVEEAVAALRSSREELRRRRIAFARLETEQNNRSASLADSALFESDRALALGEKARELSVLMGTHAYQERLRSALEQLPAPMIRPGAGNSQRVRIGRRYRLPVFGRLLTGMSEISDAGVHARGLTFETPINALVTAPRAGTIAFAGRFRSYGNIVIIDHGSGWTTLITNLGPTEVKTGDRVRMGSIIGRAAPDDHNLTVELRRNGRPQSITPLLTG